MKVTSTTTRASDFTQRLVRLVQARQDLTTAKYPLVYKNGTFEFLTISSKDIAPTDPVLLIRAGIHGDEISGPLTIERHGDEIFDYANSQSVKLLLYPLGNPSGFSSGLRYNIDNDKGDAGNNDFLRYELEDGSMKDDIGDGKVPFKRFWWASDPSLGIHLPLETELMHKLLKEDPISQIRGSLDLHQDPDGAFAAYHYILGKAAPYKSIAEGISEICPLLKKQLVSAGHKTPMKSDDYGFIVRHDSSLSDLLYRLGVPYNVAPETMGATPLDIACMVNLLWIKGLIDLISK